MRRALLILLAATSSIWSSKALSHDADHSNDEWYQSLMQPDNPKMPCCGIADAYWADKIFVKDGKTYAVITDDRDDKPLKRAHIPVGTVVEVPNNKLKWDRSNPTGHTVVFLTSTGYVMCFVQGTGI